MMFGKILIMGISWRVALAMIAGATAFFLVYRIYQRIKYRHNDLRELGFFQEVKRTFTDPKTGAIHQKVLKAKVAVAWHGNKLVFKRYNRAFALPDFERLKPNLEHLFHCKIDEISSKKPPFYLFWHQPKIVLATEAFKKLLPDLHLLALWIADSDFKTGEVAFILLDDCPSAPNHGSSLGTESFLCL